MRQLNDFEDGYDLGVREATESEEQLHQTVIDRLNTTVWNAALDEVLAMLAYRNEQYIAKVVRDMKK